MALPLLPILAGAGSLIGGVQGYRQSGGDLGATALGALTGGTLTSGIGGLGRRFAGAALGKTALGQMAPKLMQAGNPLGAVLTAAPAAAGIGAAGLIGLPAAAALSGPLGGAASKLTGQAARAATGVLGAGAQATGISMPDLPGVPGAGAKQFTPTELGQYRPQNLGQTFDPLGYQQAQIQLEKQQYLQNLQNALQYAPYQEAYQQRSKEADLIRGAKAAQLATALATDAAMRQQGQLGAQRMGEGFLNNIGQAGSTQYRYF
ncbi:hypothetical protein EBT25_00275 [bacterium]|nr:hypothetical protein [bacterium]